MEDDLPRVTSNSDRGINRSPEKETKRNQVLKIFLQHRDQTLEFSGMWTSKLSLKGDENIPKQDYGGTCKTANLLNLVEFYT